MELNPDTRLRDRYIIKQELGKGGMGAVYLAYDTSLDTEVAIKTNLNPGEHSTRQFLREAQLLASLRHSNLPRVTDYFVQGDVQYLVMDYIPGQDLSNRIKTEGAKSVQEVLGWARQLGAALSYLHEQDPPVIHRDIKPANIKLTPAGQLMLVDFGIAKAVGGATTTGARGYTPGYAPPEQYGSTSTGPYSDQYSLAATLYALLTGDAPVESVERMLGQAQLQSPRHLNPAIPVHVDAALRRALSIQPEERFASVQDFVAALFDPTFTFAEKTPSLGQVPATLPYLPGTQPDSQPIPSGAPRGLNATRLILVALIVIGVLALVGSMIGGFIYLSSRVGGADDSASGTALAILELTQHVVETNAILAAQPTNELLPTATEEMDADTPAPDSSPTVTETPEIAPTPVGGGGLIAFISNRLDRRFFQVFTMKPDGSELTQITFDPVTKSDPAWSPDGTKLLYVADGGEKYGTKLGLDIWMIDLVAGSTPVNLTESAGDDYDPAWSPDGNWIAFISTRNNFPPQMYFMSPDGSNVNFITRGYSVDSCPVWSPDGNWVAYCSSINGADPRFYLRNSSGADPRPFDIQDRPMLRYVLDLAWSPNGEYLAYTYVKPGQNEIVVAVFAEKGASLLVLTNTVGNKQPTWSPDSQWLAFVSTRDLNPEIYIMDFSGRLQTNITNHPSEDLQPAWQPLLR